jgi:hypothetical protein
MSLSIETDVSILFNQNSIAPGFSDEDGKEEKEEKHSPAFFTPIPQREGEREEYGRLHI